MRHCASCQTTWRARTARWCSRCGEPLAPAPAPTSRRRSGPRRRTGSAAAAAVVVVAAAVALQTTPLPDGLALGRPAPGGGTVELTDATEPSEATAADASSPAMSLANPPADAPWLTEDGGPWHGDVTLQQDGLATSAQVGIGVAEPLPEAGGWQHRLASDPVAAATTGDLLVTATSDGSIHGLAQRDGSPRWQARVHGRVTGIELDGEVVLVTHGPGRLSVLDARDGRVRWRWFPDTDDRDGVLAAGLVDGAPLAVVDSARRPRLVALDPVDGTPRWQVEGLEGWVADSRRLLTEPLAVVDRQLRAYDPATGGQRWAIDLHWGEVPAEVVNALVVLRSPNGHRWITADTGEVRFMSGPLLGSWVALADGGVVLASRGQARLLAAVNADGTSRWARQLPDGEGVWGCCIAMANAAEGRLLVADRRGTDHLALVLDAGTGSIQADLSDLDAGGERTLLGASGQLALLAGGAGTLAIDLDSRLPSWRLPEPVQVLTDAPLLLGTAGAAAGGPGRPTLLSPG